MELILSKYSKEREAFNYFMNNPGEIEKRLAAGEEKAKLVAYDLLDRIRTKLGFR
jgi:tryptophanyl-tRNA synthetase